MSKQMSDMNVSRGAPYGRRSSSHISLPCRLFQVRLDSGGYDDGCAYWGTGEPLWCARDDEGNEQFVRAPSRSVAAHLLGLTKDDLKDKREVSPLQLITYRNYGAFDDFQVVLPVHEADKFSKLPWIQVTKIDFLPCGCDLPNTSVRP